MGQLLVRNKNFNEVTKALIYIVVFVGAAFMLLPFFWMLSASLKLEKDVFSYPFEWIPREPVWNNYKKIWTKVPFLTYILNTAKLTVIITILQILSSSFAAYAFAKLTFKGRDFLFLGYVATIAVPWQVYMVPQFILMRHMGLTNNHMALIMLQAFSAFGVFLMRQFFLSVPNELLQAARIDGLSEYGIYTRIMMPLSKPAVATLTIFTFVFVWNDFMGPLIYLHSDRLKTIQLGLRNFISQYSADYALIMAASIVAVIPVVIMFLLLQRFFIEGVANSGIKG